MNNEPERVVAHELPVSLLLAETFGSSLSTSAVADVDEDEDVKKGRAESEKAEFTLAEVNRVTEQMDAEWGRDLSLSENLEHVSDLIDRDVITARVAQMNKGVTLTEGGYLLLDPLAPDTPQEAEALALRESCRKLGKALSEEIVKAMTRCANPVPLHREFKKRFPNPRALMEWVADSVNSGVYTLAELVQYARDGGDPLTASRIEAAGRELGLA